VRINLGLVQADVDVMWDLAPHDLSIIDFIMPDDVVPVSVSAVGSDPLGVGHACVAYVTVHLSNGAIAHMHLNWLSPVKVRSVMIGGSDRMLVWDDIKPAQRLSIYDAGADLGDMSEPSRREALVAYRIGDMVAPALPEVEALSRVAAEFRTAIETRDAPETDGWSGLRVLAMLDAAARSLEAGGASVPVPVIAVHP
jgi:predicted dehydrogenase